MQSSWYVYLVRCRDGSLYCGIAKSVEKRIRQHNEGKGAKYTRSRRPVELVWRVAVTGRGAAQKLEYRIKRMPKAKKEALARKYLIPGWRTLQFMKDVSQGYSRL